MAERQNVTLSLPKETLRHAKVMAAKRGESLSGLLARTIEELVERESGYAAAWASWREMTANARSLGIHGKPTWTRDELHERERFR